MNNRKAFVIVLIVGMIAGCAGGPDMRGRLRSETETETEIEAAEGSEVESTTETVTRQDLSQMQQGLEQKLVEGVGEVKSLVQNVTSTVRNYGLAPENRKLWAEYGRYAVQIAVSGLSALLGFALIFVAAPSPFKRETVKLAAYGAGALLVVGPPILLLTV